MRPPGVVGQQSPVWLLFILRLRKCFRLRYISLLLFLIVIVYLRILEYPTANSFSDEKPNRNGNRRRPFPPDVDNSHLLDKCNFDQVESLLRYKSPREPVNNNPDDIRPKPSVERLTTLFKILISYEEKFRPAFDYLKVFRFTKLYDTLRPFADNTQRLHEIYCLFQRYITISDNGHIDVTPNLITYLQQLSTYLSDGFVTEHPLWKDEKLLQTIQKPVIVLGANARFYDTLQASMRTVNQYWSNNSVAIYDLGFQENQLKMIKENCERCEIIPFPFDEIASVAPHIRNLPNFAWKPVVVQDAVRRFGSIIYGDTSVRYMTSHVERLLIDNLQRGFSCRELPGHYLSCFTLSGTISWFNESYAAFDDVYIAEAGFVAVTDSFLSRLVLKTWVTCALDSQCISPADSRAQCKRVGGATGTHRFDQSAMVVVLSFFYFQSKRQNENTEPAPYDMFASIQQKIAEVRRFEGDSSYFTRRKFADIQGNVSIITTTTAAPV